MSSEFNCFMIEVKKMRFFQKKYFKEPSDGQHKSYYLEQSKVHERKVDELTKQLDSPELFGNPKETELKMKA